MGMNGARWIAMVGWMIACSSGATPAKAPLMLTNSNDEQTVLASSGQEIDLTLQTIGPGNYGEPVISSTSVQFVQSSYPALQNPGGPMQLYHFFAREPGGAVIRIPHSQRAAFMVTIEVQ